MNTSLKLAVKLVAIKAVTDAIDIQYIEECGESLLDIYWNEYGSKGIGARPQWCKDYLQGLPSVCSIDFYNHDILNLVEQRLHKDIPDELQDAVIDLYWQEAGEVFFNLIRPVE